MSSVLVLENERPEQLDLLLKVAREMGIRISSFDETFDTLSEKEENKMWQQTSLKSMEDEYLHSDNDHWDEFFKSTPQQQ
jgi:protein-disulfide isomerase-like protein with CxxC motif